MGHAIDERAVVGQQQKAGAVEIKPAAGDEPSNAERRRHEVQHGRPPSRVGHCRQIASGLVQDQIDAPVVGLPDRGSVHLHRVARHHETVQVQCLLAVHRDDALHDQRRRPAARADSGRYELLDQGLGAGLGSWEDGHPTRVAQAERRLIESRRPPTRAAVLARGLTAPSRPPPPTGERFEAMAEEAPE